MELTPFHFDEFFSEVHCAEKKPFPWQRRLARQVADQGWPDQLALPTASGKTSTIDIAVFQLALQAGRSAIERTAALRIFFVIDRRVVVDQAAKHAKELAKALREAKNRDSVVGEVAHRLREFGAATPLKVAVLRGGTYRDDTWVDRPNQPLVCVSTVDQVGSRLLFRGYGLSEGQRPVHAGLVGCDSLFLLDEAHLSNAFLETLEAVVRYQWKQSPAVPGLRFVSMSATPARDRAEVFHLDDEDRVHRVLGPRLAVRKLASLREAKRFEEEAASAAIELRGRADVVGVVVNRVTSARQIFERLNGAILLTGRSRPFERDQLMDKFDPFLHTGAAERKPMFVVATQTIEVGADFDFDALVTESAPLDALRQRFGRLNRGGRSGLDARAVILRRPRQRDRLDPIYGEPLDKTWEWLKSCAGISSEVDFGTQALDRLVREHPADGLRTSADSAPLLFPAHLEAWCQTNPAPVPDPDIAPFLHGSQARTTVDAQVVWRADLSASNLDQWAKIVELAPPVVGEAMPVPVHAVRHWLQQVGEAEVADIEGPAAEDDEEESTRTRPFLIWRGPEKSDVYDRGDELYPGAMIVVPSEYGGADGWGWDPKAAEPVKDIGDDCSNALARVGARRYRLRLHPRLCPELGEALREIVSALSKEEIEKNEEEEIWERLREIAKQVLGEELPSEARGWRRPPSLYPDGSGVLLIAKARGRLPIDWEETGEESTDEEDAGSFTREVTWYEHTEGVRKIVCEFGRGCGLGEGLIGALCEAALLHDLGKFDERFQAMLRGRIRRPDEKVLAKSDFATESERRRARQASGYPTGGRHEFVSAAMAIHDSALAGESRDLIIYLVGAHHGWGRGLAPVVDDPEPEEVVAQWNGRTWRASSDHGFYRADSDWPERFDALQREYGYWGLAYLEAMLRRADCVRSREEEQQ